MTLVSVHYGPAERDQQIEAKAQPDREEERNQVRAAVNGDAAAFAELYDRHVVRVYRHIYYLVHDRTSAEDLTSQTFLKAWEALPRYRDQGAPFAAWLLRIGHNVSISYLRSERGHSELEDTHIDQKAGGSPEEALRRAEDQKEVREAIMKLRDEQRQVIMLRFVEELDYPQVATVVGKSVPAVRVIQHRALGNLRKIMLASA